MFQIQNELLVKEWPATVEIPVDGGSVRKEKITLDLLVLDTEKNARVLCGDEAVIKSIVKGWSGIGDASGNPLPYSEENLNAVMKNQLFVIAVIRAYQQASNGQAAEKNS